MPLYPQAPPLVRTDLANTWTTGAQSMAAATDLLVPTSAGFAPSANGSVGFDTTQRRLMGRDALFGSAPYNRALQVSQLGNDSTVGLVAATITTVETAFATVVTLPANYLIANKGLILSYVLRLTTSAGNPTITPRLRIGGIAGTIVFALGAVSPTAAQTNLSMVWKFIIIGTAAASASTNVVTGADLQAWPGVTAVSMCNTIAQPVLIVTNASQAVALTIQYSAGTAGNTTFLDGFIVEECN